MHRAFGSRDVAQERRHVTSAPRAADPIQTPQSQHMRPRPQATLTSRHIQENHSLVIQSDPALLPHHRPQNMKTWHCPKGRRRASEAPQTSCGLDSSVRQTSVWRNSQTQARPTDRSNCQKQPRMLMARQRNSWKTMVRDLARVPVLDSLTPQRRLLTVTPL